MSSRALLFVCALGAAACSPPITAQDAAPDATSDGAQGPMDATPSDSADVALAPHPSCDAIIDLERMGTVADGGEGVSFTGDNLEAPEGVSNALQPPTGRCEFRVVKQRLFRYRLRTDAALRVSTNNPGSEASFDSTIFVALAPCGAPPRVLACNDDDPFAPRNPHVTLSLATTGGLRAGTEVIISVAGFYPAPGSGQGSNPMGEAGNFELTVTEIPSRNDGETCDSSGRMNVCVAGSSCLVADDGRASCVRNGSRPAARCAEGQVCAEPLECDVRRDTCFATSAMEGAVCEIGESSNRCGPGLSCVTALRGQRRGRCARNGTLGASCASEDGGATTCDAGLRCTGGVCKRTIASGARCNVQTDACPDGMSCVADGAGGGVGACVANGSVHLAGCRDSASECDGALFCIVDSSRERTCRTVGRASGERCDNRGVCSFEWPCVVDDPSRPTEGVCRLPGETGTECQNDMGCTGGRRCVGRTSSANGRCLAVVNAGDACDIERRTNACATGFSCVRMGASGAAGRCVANGSAAGSACRAMSPTCDAGLSCANDLGARCVASAASGEACDPRFNTVRCASGAVCAASEFEAGRCAMASMESEPNDARAMGAMGANFAVRGAVGRFDVDCFGVTVAASGALFAQAVNPNGQCTNNLVLDLYGPDGAFLGTDSDAGPAGCPRIDGAVYPWARGLPAGTYSVCVREPNNNIVGAYALSVAATTR
ncbi:MAG: hypothetical protein JNK05_40910 [Myxococcales bacterium]|nr:hypothetical protein [Myxococcales bacterium]